MKRYLGVKMVNAEPMTRQAYNDFRGWDLPSGEDGDDAGYLVEYLDGGKANTEKYDNYVSWSPARVFIRAYRTVDGMSFGVAIEVMKIGSKVARQGWDGKHMQMVDGQIEPWPISQTDALADDWMIID